MEILLYIITKKLELSVKFCLEKQYPQKTKLGKLFWKPANPFNCTESYDYESFECSTRSLILRGLQRFGTKTLLTIALITQI